MTLFFNLELALEDQSKKSRLRRLKEFTPHDVYTLTIPYLLSSAVASIIVAYICFPSLSVLMYSSIPKRYQNWMTWTVLILEDSRCLAVLICIGIPMWLLQVMNFELVIHRLERLSESLQRCGWLHYSRNMSEILIYL